MSEKVENKKTKKKGKGLIIFLVIVAVIALVAFGYVKYLDGAFNGILSSFEFTKDWVVQDLDFDDNQDASEDTHIEEKEFSDNCEADYLVDDQGIVQAVKVEYEAAEGTLNESVLAAAKAAAKVVKGVEFNYEVDEDGEIELDIKFAPGDIDQSVFDKLKEFGLMNDENINELKGYLDNPTVDNINELIQKVIK